MEYSLRTAGDAPDSGVAASRVNRLPKRGESGFTLVEVLVAIVVLSITGLAAAQFAITAIRTSYAQQQRSTAVSLGDDGMERMRAQIANVDANQYLDELIKGMGETSVTAAQKNLSDVGAITSQLADLSYTSSPDPDKSKYIQPVRATAGKDAKHTEYTVNTVWSAVSVPAARSRARPHLSWAFPVVPQRAIRPIPQQAPRPTFWIRAKRYRARSRSVRTRICP